MVADTSRASDGTNSTADMARTFSALQTLLLSVEGIDSFLQEVAELAGQLGPLPVSCGITTEHQGHPLTVASSDGRAESLDESQYEAHDGPCLLAMRTREVVDVADIDDESRWPKYLAHAREVGLRSSLSVPLIVQGSSIGALNLYKFDRAHAFSGQERARVEVFAAQASIALVLALRGIQSSQTNAQLEEALTSRSIIDQALGILMGQQRCSADEAFALLRTHSQNNHRKLRDVAADLVARSTESPPSSR